MQSIEQSTFAGISRS
ncbi:hypothetical protein EYZ11_011150 [Aspergillus tanneri]|uniref:Uncharacterized protein n=1 Tax=Aspergillus tanneri TaxID=1220188 RepID=A0A4S3J3V9_9EURO|nr:hypothetical protein EYZ11_011150 [Aspergillus tanneri]